MFAGSEHEGTVRKSGQAGYCCSNVEWLGCRGRVCGAPSGVRRRRPSPRDSVQRGHALSRLAPRPVRPRPPSTCYAAAWSVVRIGHHNNFFSYKRTRKPTAITYALPTGQPTDLLRSRRPRISSTWLARRSPMPTAIQCIEGERQLACPIILCVSPDFGRHKLAFAGYSSAKISGNRRWSPCPPRPDTGRFSAQSA